MATAFSERLDLELCSIYSINSFHAFHATRIDIPGRTNERTNERKHVGTKKKKGRGKNAMVKPNHANYDREEQEGERKKKGKNKKR